MESYQRWMLDNVNARSDEAYNRVFELNNCSKIHINSSKFLQLDTLDIIRSNAREDFDSNGTAVELDEIDVCQTQLRSVHKDTGSKNRTDESVAQTDNPVLAEFLALREKRRMVASAEKQSRNICVFCRNNGELQSVYQSHVLKDSNGRTVCPILRKYICPLCGTSGDRAHTIRYCPLNEGGLVPGIGALLKTHRLSTGKLKKNRMDMHC